MLRSCNSPVICAPLKPVGVQWMGQVADREMIGRLETGAFAKPAIKLPVELVMGETT